MPKRVCWKKGMRLTDEILTLSDKCDEELVRNAFALSANGHFGLFPNSRPFRLSLEISKETIEAVMVDCLGLTKDGTLIDVCYDTCYSGSFDTRVMISALNMENTYLLCIYSRNVWKDTNDGLCEPEYAFSLIEENSPVPQNALPVARIVYDELCWRMDESDFVPPCLYVSSHNAYRELSAGFSAVLRNINDLLPEKLLTGSNDALKIFWPAVQWLEITVDKEGDTMTPMALLGNIQKLVGAFACACTLDEYVNLGEPERYFCFARVPYNYMDVYCKIREGLDLCRLICDKVRVFDAVAPERIEAPVIDPSQLRQTIRYGGVKIKVTNNTPGATVYYTTDGSEPGTSSRTGTTISLESGFSEDWHKEPDKKFVIKVMAYKDGASSRIETYDALVRKGNPFEGRQI